MVFAAGGSPYQPEGVFVLREGSGARRHGAASPVPGKEGLLGRGHSIHDQRVWDALRQLDGKLNRLLSSQQRVERAVCPDQAGGAADAADLSSPQMSSLPSMFAKTTSSLNQPLGLMAVTGQRSLFHDDVDHGRQWLKPRSFEALRLSQTLGCLLWMDSAASADGTLGCGGRKCVLDHDSTAKTLFDTVGALVLLLDAIAVPLAMAWDKGLDGPWDTIALASLCYWTADMVLGFFTTYTKNGFTVTALSRTSVHYLKSWFLLDFSTVSIDWLVIFTDAVTGESRIPAVVRVIRFLKLVRLFRAVAKLKDGRYANMMAAIQRKAALLGLDVHFKFVTGVGRVIFCMLWLTHVGSCIWWIVVKGSDLAGATWHAQLLAEFGRSTVSGDDQGWWYLSGLYWAAACMFSGASPMVPKSGTEMALSLTFVLFGVVVGSTLVSSFAAMLVEFNSTRRDQQSRLSTLSQFLRQNAISATLSCNILVQAKKRIVAVKKISQADVTLLQYISPHLLRLLSYQLHGRRIATVPLLGAFSMEEDHFMKSLCSVGGAFDTTPVSPGYLLFAPQEVCESASLVLDGSVLYSKDSAGTGEQAVTMTTPVASEHNGVHVGAGSWLADVCLWVEWRSQGIAEFIEHGEVLQLHAAEVRKLLRAHPRLARLAAEYSAALAAVLRDAELSDLREDMDVDVCVMQGLSGQLRASLSMPVLRQLRAQASSRASQENVAKLKAEVADHKSSLVCINGDPLRLVFLVTVQLWARGRHLVEVGTISGEGVLTRLPPALPGAKLRIGESGEAAARRILESRFARLKVEGLQSIGRVTETADSARYMLKTCYHKQRFLADADLGACCGCGDLAATLVLQHPKALLQEDADRTMTTELKVFGWFDAARDEQELFAWVDDAELDALRSAEEVEIVNFCRGVEF